MKRIPALIAGGALVGLALVHGMGLLGGFPWSSLIGGFPWSRVLLIG